MILFSSVSISAVGPTKIRIRGVEGTRSRYIKRSGREANNYLNQRQL